MKQIGVLLSGCGVYDGSEIHEAVFTLLSIAENGGNAVCIAPDKQQHHVINHLNGEELPEKRNILIESARIARGKIISIEKADVTKLDALVLPGGFGAAKNLTTWAFDGPAGDIDPLVRRLILSMHKSGKAIVAFCMGPTVLAKALEGGDSNVHLTVGSTEEASPYDIKGISAGMETVGAVAEMKTVREILMDRENKIITAPCYMMEAGIDEVRTNIKTAMDVLFKMI